MAAHWLLIYTDMDSLKTTFSSGFVSFEMTWIAASELCSSSLGESVWSKLMSTEGSRAALVLQGQISSLHICVLLYISADILKP